MKLIESISEMQQTADLLRGKGVKIGIVPTMGYLHEGHLSLIREAKVHSDVVVTTIFVNPIQFAPNEDYKKYPRDLERDILHASSAGSDFLFVPSVEEMYPPDYLTFVEVEKITSILEGKSRPSHFRGVTTVVAKFFNIIKPHIALFGQKDAQQAIVIKQMVRDLNYGIKIIIAPIVREGDGLAMSSRNVYLSPEERKESAMIYKSLKRAEELILSGEREASRVVAEIVRYLNTQPLIEVDYVSVTDADTLEECPVINEKSQILISVAVRVGTTRLIDNIIVNT